MKRSRSGHRTCRGCEKLLAGLGHAQSHYPACRLCGQRAIRLDKFGLCSKKATQHEEWRAAARADMKAGAR